MSGGDVLRERAAGTTGTGTMSAGYGRALPIRRHGLTIEGRSATPSMRGPIAGKLLRARRDGDAAGAWTDSLQRLLRRLARFHVRSPCRSAPGLPAALLLPAQDPATRSRFRRPPAPLLAADPDAADRRRHRRTEKRSTNTQRPRASVKAASMSRIAALMPARRKAKRRGDLRRAAVSDFLSLLPYKL